MYANNPNSTMDVNKPNRHSTSKYKNCQYKFLLTAFPGHEKVQLAKQILALGGVYYETQEYKPECTHIVSGKPIRSEKYLCGCAQGKWLVTRDYVYASAKAGKWLNAAKYEWGQKITENHDYPIPLLMAPKRWRENREEKSCGPFQGWKTMIMVENIKRRPIVYKRLLEAGGAKVVPPTFKLEDLNGLAKTLTHVFVDKKFENNVKAFSRRGIPCLSPDYIAETLLQDTTPDTKPFCVSIYTAGLSIGSSSRESSSSSSSSSSSKPSSQSTSNSLLNSQSSSATNSAASTPGKRIQHIPQKLLTEAITTALMKDEHQKNISTPTVSPFGDPRGVKRKLLESEDRVRDIILRVRKKKSEQSGPSFVPYCFEMLPIPPQFKKKCALPFNRTIASMIEATIEEGMWFGVIGGLQSHISTTRYPPPYLMHQLMITMMKSSNQAVVLGAYHLLKQVLCLHCPATSPALRLMYMQSLSTTMYNERQDCSSGGEWTFVCNVISMALGKDPGETDNCDAAIQSLGGYNKQQVHCQPPSGDTNQHGKPPSSDQHGNPPSSDQHGNPPSSDQHGNIPSSTEDNRAVKVESNSDTSVTNFDRNNCTLLLRYLVTLFEQDFIAIVERQKTSPRKTPHMKPALTRQCILSCLLWPNGYPNAISTAVITLLDFLVKTLKLAMRQPNTTQLLNMVQRMVTIAAECYQQVNVKLDMNGLNNEINELDFAKEIMNAVTEGGLLNCYNSVSLLLETTQPAWLRMRLAECLLGTYDNSLIHPENKPLCHKKLSLQKLVCCYLYLLPKGPENTTLAHVLDKSNVGNIENQQPTMIARSKKSTRSPAALHTLADSNTVKSFVQKGGRKRTPFSPTNTGSENEQQKKKVLAVHKRNARGETPLHLACMKSNLAKVKELLSFPGIDVNAKDNAGWTPLHEACNHGNFTIVKELLKYKSTPTILSFFAKASKPSKCGVDLFAAPKCGTTPLHDAIFNGHANIARILVKAGACGQTDLVSKACGQTDLVSKACGQVDLVSKACGQVDFVSKACGQVDFVSKACGQVDLVSKACGQVDLVSKACGQVEFVSKACGQVDFVSKACGKELLMAKNSAGFTPIDCAQTDEMKAALHLSSEHGQSETESSSQESQSQGSYSSQLDSSSQGECQRLPTSTMNINCPTDHDYDVVLKRHDGKQTSYSENECLQYITIVLQLLKAYVKVTNLQLFKFELDQSCSSNLSIVQLSSEEKEICDNVYPASKKRKLQGGRTVVILNDFDDGSTRPMSIPGYDEKSVIDDLLYFADLDSHMQKFERHLTKLSPSGKLSDQCKRRLLDLQLLSSPY
ncbi:SMC5-SMC6 complex localization factor protein 1-like [Glandiceps talaboti]